MQLSQSEAARLKADICGMLVDSCVLARATTSQDDTGQAYQGTYTTYYSGGCRLTRTTTTTGREEAAGQVQDVELLELLVTDDVEAIAGDRATIGGQDYKVTGRFARELSFLAVLTITKG